jgi:hypothetical protein
MPRKQTARPSPAVAPPPDSSAIRTNASPYVRDIRWATPSSRRRTDVFVVDVSDRSMTESAPSEGPLALTA